MRIFLHAYDFLPLTRWLDKSGRPIEDHPKLPANEQKLKLLARRPETPLNVLLSSGQVRETMNTKRYDVEKIDKGTTFVEPALMRLLQKQATNNSNDSRLKGIEHEIAILRSPMRKPE